MLKIHKISLAALFCFASITSQVQATLSDAVIVQCYEGRDSQYKYLEYLFVYEPAQRIKAHGQWVASTLLAAVPAYIVGKHLNATVIKDYCNKSSDVSEKTPTSNTKSAFTGIDAALFGATIVLTKVVFYDMYMAQFEKSVKKETLINFLKNIDFHKKHIPTQLVPAFEELAQAAAEKNYALTNDQVVEIYTIINHLLEHEFAKRYEKEKDKGFDALGFVKTITDIKKNL